MELRISIPNRPICKKNNMRAFCISGCKGWNRGQGSQPKKLMLQSEDYCKYEKMALKWLRQWGNIQFDKPVVLECHYWLPDRRSRPDLGNLLAGTCDILEAAGILQNDRLVVRFGDSCILGIDKGNPRVDITIREVE